MIDVGISDCCNSCDGHACDESATAPRLAVTVSFFGRRWLWAERRLLAYLLRHISINGHPPRELRNRGKFSRRDRL